jgi:hypothetical protein
MNLFVLIVLTATVWAWQGGTPPACELTREAIEKQLGGGQRDAETGEIVYKAKQAVIRVTYDEGGRVVRIASHDECSAWRAHEAVRSVLPKDDRSRLVSKSKDAAVCRAYWSEEHACYRIELWAETCKTCAEGGAVVHWMDSGDEESASAPASQQ